MKIYIPSYRRASTQKTLCFLNSIGCPREDIVICVQTPEDYERYQVWNSMCSVVYKPARNIAQNRNNVLSQMEMGEKALMIDDDLTKIFLFTGEGFKPVEKYDEFIEAINKAFEYCERHNSHLFCLAMGKNLFYRTAAAKRAIYAQNKLGGQFFGIIKTGIQFDETLETKEDFDFILAHIASGENTILANSISYQTTYEQMKGGCYGVHTAENERNSARAIHAKYPNLTEIKDETEIAIISTLRLDYGSPRWTGEIADCSLPLTFDTYSNCSFGCVYCFSQYQRGIGEGSEDYYAKKVRAVNPEKIKKIFSGEDKGQFYQYIKDRRPIQYGGLSDQFDGFERKYGITYEILSYLREINYPICFSTKSSWVFKDHKYRELFRGADNWNVKFSIITLDPKDAARIEVGVPSPQERLEAMREYNTLSKGGTTLRLRPFIVGVTDKTYLDLIRAAKDAGATAVTTEFFCLEMRSIKKAKEHYDVISECCGFDIVDFYRRYSNGTGYLRLNRKVKQKYIEKMRDLCNELGMRFYVSDAHFKECSDNCCCCGLPPGWDYSRGNFAAALQIAKKCGEVRWTDIEKDMKYLEFSAGRAAGCQIARSSQEAFAKFSGMTMKDFLRYLWNNPRQGQSPYKIFERVLRPDGVDENGDIIYRYDGSVTFEPMQGKDRAEVLEMRV